MTQAHATMLSATAVAKTNQGGMGGEKSGSSEPLFLLALQ